MTVGRTFRCPAHSGIPPIPRFWDGTIHLAVAGTEQHRACLARAGRAVNNATAAAYQPAPALPFLCSVDGWTAVVSPSTVCSLARPYPPLWFSRSAFFCFWTIRSRVGRFFRAFTELQLNAISGEHCTVLDAFARRLPRCCPPKFPTIRLLWGTSSWFYSLYSYGPYYPTLLTPLAPWRACSTLVLCYPYPPSFSGLFMCLLPLTICAHCHTCPTTPCLPCRNTQRLYRCGLLQQDVDSLLPLHCSTP